MQPRTNPHWDPHCGGDVVKIPHLREGKNRKGSGSGRRERILIARHGREL